MTSSLTVLFRGAAVAIAAWVLAATAARAGEIALTFDDVPGQDGRRFTGAQRTERLIEELHEAGVEQAAFFVITNRLDDDKLERIRAYGRAGHLLGNHGHRHARAAEIAGDEFSADLRRAHRVLHGLPGFFPYFRFPFLNEGFDEATRRSVLERLADAGYERAYVTVNTFDWCLDDLYQRAGAGGRTIDYPELGRLYIDAIWRAVAFYDRAAGEQLGRSSRHVLLLHENDLAALFIGDLVRHLRAEGWRIISPAAAYENPMGSQTPATLLDDRRRVAALAVREPAKAPVGRPAFEDTSWLEAQFERVVARD